MPKETTLKLDWASYEAMAFACRHWHYSKSIPAGKSVKIGVWENDTFIGVVTFGRGANNHIGSPYGLQQTQVCELTRIALKGHQTPVTKIVSIAIKMLKKQSPGVELIVSYADLAQGHAGTIYKAGNWIYEGLMKDGHFHYLLDGVRVHPRTISSRYGSLANARKKHTVEVIQHEGKHKFLYPLSARMRKQLSKRGGSVGSDTSGYQSGEAGATPSSPHQDDNRKATSKAKEKDPTEAKESGGQTDQTNKSPR